MDDRVELARRRPVRAGSSGSASRRPLIPSSDAIRRTRSMWLGSETKTADPMPWSAHERGDPPDRLERRPARVLGSGSPPRGRRARSRRPRALAASVVRSPSRLPPVTIRRGATPSWKSSIAWSRRAANTGDGRPSYWAAPMTTIASAAGPFVAVALVPDPVGGIAADRDAGDQPRDDQPSEQRAPTASADQRPWHFLYFAPEPHQQGSLRPIRSPVGV